MKRLGMSIAMAMLTTVWLVAGDQDAERLLKAAMNTELVDGNMKAAIDQYKRIVDVYSKSDRATAAQALLRMAEAYQRLGDVEAQRAYERVVREFPDRPDAVALARARLQSPAGASNAKADRAVWTGSTVDLSGRVSPDGRLISFIDWSDGRLMIREIATGAERALTAAAAPIYSEAAQWSAISRDGRNIAYEWITNGGRPEVRIAALPTSGLAQPRRFVIPNAASFSSFDWSPDGKWIATTFEHVEGTGVIGLIAVADGSLRQLKSVDRSAINTLRNPTSIFLSVDGKYLAYDRPPSGATQQRDVFVLAVDDGREIPVAVHAANDAVVGWSPDGSRLLFSSDRTGAVGLWAQAFADGETQGSPELLKPDTGPMYSLGLTASGTLYVHRRINTRDVAIAPIDLQAGTFLRPPTGFKQGFGAGAQNPAWSPDGKHLAYPVDCRDGCVAIRSVATGEMRRVGATLTESRVVDWSSDGQSLLMKSRDATGRDGVFRIDVASGQAAPIFLSDGLSVVAHWSPDGRKIYFNRRGMFVERDLTTGTERDVSDDTGELFGALSPDGRYFAVARADRVANTTSLLLVPVNGGQTREVLRLMPPEGLFRPGEGAWTPDSAALIVQKHTGSRWELWFVPVTGAPPRKLAIDPAIWREGIAVSTSGAVRVFQGDGAFSLSPDGRTAAVVIGRAVNEVWALENFMPAPTRSR